MGAILIAAANIGVDIWKGIEEKKSAKEAEKQRKKEQAWANLLSAAGGGGVTQPTAPIKQTTSGDIASSALGAGLQGFQTGQSISNASQDAAQLREYRDTMSKQADARTDLYKAQATKALMPSATKGVGGIKNLTDSQLLSYKNKYGTQQVSFGKTIPIQQENIPLLNQINAELKSRGYPTDAMSGQSDSLGILQ